MENSTPGPIALQIQTMTAPNPISFWDRLRGEKEKEHILVSLTPVDPQSASKRLLIVVGRHEARQMAIAIEGLTAKIPLTHDLLKNATDAFGYRLESVIIDKMIDNQIFHSTMHFSNGEKKVSLSARASDAVTMALKYKCPIFVAPDLLENQGHL